MLLSAVLIGGSILAATSIAGYLMLLQIRQSTDIANSGKAITAASSGVDWALYQLRTGKKITEKEIEFNNGSRVRVTRSGGIISSVGNSGNSYRAFELNTTLDSTIPPME